MSEHDDAADTPEASAKRTVLARRARFVAAAVASVGIACGKTTVTDPAPMPCLSVAPLTDSASPMPSLTTTAPPSPPVPEAGAWPMPCLSVARPVVDAGPKGDKDGSVRPHDAGTATKPQRPQMCLKAAPWPDDDDFGASHLEPESRK